MSPGSKSSSRTEAGRASRTRTASSSIRCPRSAGAPATVPLSWLPATSRAGSSASACSTSTRSRPPERRGSEQHDPLGAAAAVLVLALALAAVPVRPPDPLEVVDLYDDQDDTPDEDLRPAHGSQPRGTDRCLSMGRLAYLRGRPNVSSLQQILTSCRLCGTAPQRPPVNAATWFGTTPSRTGSRVIGCRAATIRASPPGADIQTTPLADESSPGGASSSLTVRRGGLIVASSSFRTGRCVRGLRFPENGCATQTAFGERASDQPEP